jgi:superfamily I DNA/RNA helicase/mRNA-degrading endonuclease RelE of RelBE toxin-antitoxin system
MAAHLVFSKQFSRDLERLPPNIRAKVPKSFVLLCQDYRHNSLGTERFEGGTPGIYECRIDDKYRMLVYPRGDDIHLLLADDHDRAYRRGGVIGRPAKTHIADPDLPEFPQEVADAPQDGGVFAGFTDLELCTAGVPSAHVAHVRSCTEVDEVCDLEELSEETKDRLINAALHGEEGPIVRVNPASEEEAAECLDRPQLVSKIELPPEARDFLEKDIEGPWIVKGGAGSGKTILGIRLALKEARQPQLFGDPDQARVLFLCFNRSLAKLIQDECASALGKDHSAVEVSPIDAWSLDYLKSRGKSPALLSNDERDGVLRDAMNDVKGTLDAKGRIFLDSPLSFFTEEITQVIEGRVGLNIDSYLSIIRVGRGRRLDEGHRRIVWKLYERYSELLNTYQAIDWGRLGSLTRKTLDEDSDPPSYSLVIVDEAQDLSPAKLRVCTSLAENGRVVFMADATQNIYRPGFQWKDLKKAPKKLTLGRNLRQSAVTHRFLEYLAEELTEDEVEPEDQTEYGAALKAGQKPSIVRCRGLENEIDFVIQGIMKCIDGERDPGEIMVLARKRRLVHAIERRLVDSDIPVARHTERDSNNFFDETRVKVLTVHAAKGLEAPVVFVVDVNEGSFPIEFHAQSDKEAEEHLRRSKRLLYVACSRAEQELWLMCSQGKGSPFLSAIPDGIVREMRWPVVFG